MNYKETIKDLREVRSKKMDERAEVNAEIDHLTRTLTIIEDLRDADATIEEEGE